MSIRTSRATSDRQEPHRSAQYVGVTVKFDHAITLDDDRRLLAQLESQGIALAVPRDAEVARLFRSSTPDELRALARRAEMMAPPYVAPNLLSYLRLILTTRRSAEGLLDALRRLRRVDYAYIEGPNGLASLTPQNEPRFSDQDYLHAASDGVNAEFAWRLAGGDGDGVGLWDFEWGWDLNHADLLGLNVQHMVGAPAPATHPRSAEFQGHGNAVMGTAAAQINGLGCVGIVPGISRVGLVSDWYDAAADVIGKVTVLSQRGDVLLIERTKGDENNAYLGWYSMPMEADAATFDVLQLATRCNITVVEAAGNGGHRNPELQGYQQEFRRDEDDNPVYRWIFDRDRAEFVNGSWDSGAILVAAATKDAPREPCGATTSWGTNVGNRIDCHAQGVEVVTLDVNNSYRSAGSANLFSGTSAAAAIVAGVAASIQGVARQFLGAPLAPKTLREMLRDPDNGTAPKAGYEASIGYMPDLEKIVRRPTGLALREDLFLRCDAGDDGGPGPHVLGASPDIIVCSRHAADPVSEFGSVMGTVPPRTVPSETPEGDRFAYVRIWNRGAEIAVGASVTLYRAPVATLLNPSLLNRVGSSTLPAVLQGNAPSIAGPFDITGSGGGPHALFAVAGSRGDPPPTVGITLTWERFKALLRTTAITGYEMITRPESGSSPVKTANNVASRIVVRIASGRTVTGPWMTTLAFKAPGAWDSSREMKLQWMGSLPASGVSGRMEVPLGWWQRALAVAGDPSVPGSAAPNVIVAMAPGRVYLSFAVTRPTPLLVGQFPIGIAPDMRIVLEVPTGATVNLPDAVAVRQTENGDEVGRVTWRFVEP